MPARRSSSISGPFFATAPPMAYSIAYCVHTLEMNALRGWGVAFLGFVAAGSGASEGLLSPTTILTALGLIGTAASVMGNEAAIRIGRRRLIAVAMLSSAAVAGVLGFVWQPLYGVAAAMLLVYGFIVWLDSSSLTAGSAGPPILPAAARRSRSIRRWAMPGASSGR
jgi:hypothetical protein